MDHHEVTFLEAFKYDPLPFLIILLFAAAGLLLGVAALMRAMRKGSRGSGVVAIIIGLLPIGVGLGVSALMQAHLEDLLDTPGLTEDDKRLFRIAGEETAWITVRTGLFGGAPAIGLGGLALLLGGKKRS